MGRYYSGDIDGKFWFGVQDSNDADFFGVEGTQNTLNYYFDTTNLVDIKKGIKECKKQLGTYKKGFDTFFKLNDCYNDDTLKEHFKTPMEEIKLKLEWYARLGLGEQILKCVIDNEVCSFDAEL